MMVMLAAAGKLRMYNARHACIEIISLNSITPLLNYKYKVSLCHCGTYKASGGGGRQLVRAC